MQWHITSEGKFQTNLTGQTHQLFGLEIQIYYTPFSLIIFRIF